MDLTTLIERYGLASAILIYLLVYFIPKMHATLRAEVATERTRADAREDANRKVWTAEMGKERQECAERHAENMAAHQETRHGVADIAHAVGLQQLADKIRPRGDGDARPRAGG